MADPGSTGSSSSLDRRKLFPRAPSSAPHVHGLARPLFPGGGLPASSFSLDDDGEDCATDLVSYDLNVAAAHGFDFVAAGIDASASAPAFDAGMAAFNAGRTRRRATARRSMGWQGMAQLPAGGEEAVRRGCGAPTARTMAPSRGRGKAT
uniref:Uncharacterized protein n=1 Tax=Arundo donax TaxID=35708 RepID=A0A0A8YDZ3_ARUDO